LFTSVKLRIFVQAVSGHRMQMNFCRPFEFINLPCTHKTFGTLRTTRKYFAVGDESPPRAAALSSGYAGLIARNPLT
jgi:hypothetical protein